MIKYFTIACSVILIAVQPSFADKLTAHQKVERMVVTKKDDGTKIISMEPAETVLPGETLVYSLLYRNGAPESASNIVLTMPVPEEVVYVENSAAALGTQVMFSVDDGVSFSPRGDLSVSVNGVKRNALSEEISHIRWSFSEDLRPGDSGRIGYRAQLK